MTFLYIPPRVQRQEYYYHTYLFGDKRIHIFAITDQGNKKQNEDCFVVCDNLFGVFDGMSRPNGGAFASKVASYVLGIYGCRNDPAAMQSLRCDLTQYIDDANIQSIEGLSDEIVGNLERLIHASTTTSMNLRQIFIDPDGISALLEELHEEIPNLPGTTGVALELVNTEESGDELHIYYQGDSLAGYYHHARKKGCVLLIPDQAEDRKLIHWIGHNSALNLQRDVLRMDICSGVTYALWSDGIAALDQDTLFAKIGQMDIRYLTPQSFFNCGTDIVNTAYMQGRQKRSRLGADNSTLILVHVEE